MRCIAIDDEPLALELLEDNISRVPYLQLAAKFNNAMDAMGWLASNPVDLIFLDIQMPGLTGLQFIQSLPQKPLIILVTAYEKFALEGFNLDVTDYLVKPVSLDRFIRACNKALEIHQLRSHPGRPGQPEADYFFVSVDYSMLKINYADISYMEGLKDYIRIHLKNSSKPIITRMSMKNMEELLPSKQFVRIHKSYIVSISYVTAIRKNSIFLGLLELPVGDNYREAVMALTGKYGSS